MSKEAKHYCNYLSKGVFGHPQCLDIYVSKQMKNASKGKKTDFLLEDIPNLLLDLFVLLTQKHIQVSKSNLAFTFPREVATSHTQLSVPVTWWEFLV